MGWRGKYPEKGSSAASSALDMPRGRLRAWFDGAKPDPAHAVEAADMNGWLDAAPGDRIFAALTICHGWVVAGGSIEATRWMPMFVVGDGDPVAGLRDCLDDLGVGVSISREGSERRAHELRPSVNGPVLGRFLHAILGAPLGRKTDGDLSLPRWLREAPFDTRLRWARTVVSLRGTPIDPARGYRLQMREEDRPRDWYDSLGELFRELVGEADEIVVGEQSVRFRERAAAMLDVVPSLPE